MACETCQQKLTPKLCIARCFKEWLEFAAVPHIPHSSMLAAGAGGEGGGVIDNIIYVVCHSTASAVITVHNTNGYRNHIPLQIWLMSSSVMFAGWACSGSASQVASTSRRLFTALYSSWSTIIRPPPKMQSAILMAVHFFAPHPHT